MGDMKFNVECNFCRTVHTFDVEEKDVWDWHNGKLIQAAMPYLDEDAREMMISQVCSECWDRIFPEEE